MFYLLKSHLFFYFRFIFESSYIYHINRKAVTITYMCRHCNEMKIFENRCNLLAHIRSHAFKSATINVSDLKIEPLPLSYFQINIQNEVNDCSTSQVASARRIGSVQKQTRNKTQPICLVCKMNITVTRVLYKDRAKHFMQYSNENYSCPVCLFTLPTKCGLQTHLRLHLKIPPYYCPECGIHLSSKNVYYPYNHDCEGFNMMRATARFKCPVAECSLMHPNDLKQHMKDKHLKKVFKCPLCVVACFSKSTIVKHLRTHKTEIKCKIFYKCDMCPGKLVLQNQTDNHLKMHVDGFVYPCWNCGQIFENVPLLIKHYINNHEQNPDKNEITSLIPIGLNKPVTQSEKTTIMYRVEKRCAKCKRNFLYNCKYDEIKLLSNECPYKCSYQPGEKSLSDDSDLSNQIKCHLCNNNISQNWEHIKKHYAIYHKEHQCIDAQVIVKKLDVTKYLTKKRRQNMHRVSIKKKVSKKNRKRHGNSLIETVPFKGPSINDLGHYVCNKCDYECENKQILETHLKIHRDPCMAYQCLECGQCFVVKPSFTTHLLLDHNISDIEDYINKKQCYNEGALIKHQNSEIVSEQELSENQCKICREQFDNSHELEKHFRVHGMAFLMKNTSNKSNSP